MQRRNFLVTAAAATTVPMSSAVAGPSSRKIKVLDTYLTNAELFPKHASLQPGARLLLRRDPQRTYNPASIQVLDEAGVPLGYLPPVSAQVLGVLMDHGTTAEAMVSSGGKLSVSILTL